ncbi:MAG: response regulator transcription factor [Campylobacterota bacterium]|nr:response regulator transcription factor [Campylobacterota bacterium]
MIYIYTLSDNIKEYWEKEFSNEFDIKIIEKNRYEDTKSNDSDVLLLDLDMFEDIDSIEEFIVKLPNALHPIALVNEPKLAHGAYMIKKGFKSYIGKDTNKLIVKQAIDTVIDGNVWLYPQLMSYIIKHININNETTKKNDLLENLTTKEQQVASFVADGLSNKEIATKLDVQLVTVKKHIGSIFTKLHIKDRVALAILVNNL